MERNFVEELKPDFITPVEETVNDPIFCLAKRDDLYQPFPASMVNGGKVRQAVYLLGNNIDEMNEKYDGNVWFATATTSQQGAIIGSVASYFGLNSKLFVGAMTCPSSLRKNSLMMLAYKLGCGINCDCLQAYDAPLHNQMVRTADSLGTHYCDIKYTKCVETYTDDMIMPVAMQAQNLPDGIDNLIVPSGSCISLSGVIIGCAMFGKNIKNIIGVQIAGYDRSKSIDAILAKYGIEGIGKSYTLELDTDYSYSKLLSGRTMDNGRITLDPLYEAKAYDYAEKHMMDRIGGQSNAIWLVGDSTRARKYKIEKEVQSAYDEETKDYVKIYGGKELR